MEEQNVAFARHWLPAMEAGEYTLSVEQTATGIQGFAKDSASRRLIVGGERFRLGEDAVYSAYPPPNAAGEFWNTFPHAVFHDPSLPWRRVIRSADGERLPWLWLLVTDETEAAADWETTVAEALAPAAGVFVPALSLDSHEDPSAPCRVVELETAFFRAILPPRADLPFTAHVRLVNLDDKVTDPAVTGNAFSCILANRFTREPPPAGGKDFVEGLRHTARLVSLEGFEKTLRGEETITAKRVRLFCLHRWSFSVARSPFDFRSVLEALDAGVLGSSVPAGTEKDVEAVLRLGFVPLKHALRDGSAAVSWYRGPLCPAKPESAGGGEAQACAFFPDELLRYDPEWGMFDASFSVAWQTGRLLALQSPDIADGLMRWRLEEKLRAAAARNDSALARRLPKRRSRENAGGAAGNEASEAAEAVYARLLADNAGRGADTTGFRDTRYERTLAGVAAHLAGGDPANGKLRADARFSQEDLLRMCREEADEKLD